MLTTAEKAFEGARGTSEGVCAGTGVEASEPPRLSVVGRASCTLSGWPALPFTFCLPPVATS